MKSLRYASLLPVVFVLLLASAGVAIVPFSHGTAPASPFETTLNTYFVRFAAAASDPTVVIQTGPILPGVGFLINGEPLTTDGKGRITLPLSMNSSLTVQITTTTVSGASGTRYVFTNWTGDASGSSTSISLTVNSDKTIQVNFQTQYKISFTTAVLPAGITVTTTLGGTAFTDTTPFIRDFWVAADSPEYFSISPLTYQSGLTVYNFLRWQNSAGAALTSPQTIIQPDTFTASYSVVPPATPPPPPATTPAPTPPSTPTPTPTPTPTATPTPPPTPTATPPPAPTSTPAVAPAPGAPGIGVGAAAVVVIIAALTQVPKPLPKPNIPKRGSLRITIRSGIDKKR